jgi:hypothetical protein
MSEARKPAITDALPFVKLVTRGGRRDMDYWTVKPTGDIPKDTKIGAECGVAFLDWLIHSPGDLSIHSIAAAQERMQERHAVGYGWTLVSSFWMPILEAARLGFQANADLIRPMGHRYAAETQRVLQVMLEQEFAAKGAALARKPPVRKRKGGAA